MNKALKIFVGIVALLGFLSVIFLMTAKKKSLPINTAKKISAPAMPSQVTAPAVPTSQVSQISVQNQKALVSSQWQQCETKAIDAGKNLFWNVGITEAVPAGGTYAKGNLENNPAQPVHIIVKPTSTVADKINQMLVVGKTAFLRGNCTDVATDGSVVLQVF